MKVPKKIKIERIKKIKWQTDLVHNSIWLKKLTNKLMLEGKKAILEKIIYKTIVSLKIKFKKNPVALFDKTLLLARPIFIFVVKRVSSKNYQVPVPVNFRRQIITSLAWITESVLDRKEQRLELKLFNEFSSFLQNKETSLTMKKNKHYDNVTENRVNARYRWV
jgi:small subunit ribosomal protein S7